MTATFMRRAVSPLQFEPLEPNPDDILCPGSDADEPPEERKRKRRRIEEAGSEYLRGKSLYITSAQLRGPFPDHWQNPYATKQSEVKTSLRRPQIKSTKRQVPSEQDREAAFQIQDSEVQTTAQQLEIEVEVDASAVASCRKISPERRVSPAKSENAQPSVQDGAEVTQDSFVTAKDESYEEAVRTQPARNPRSKSHDWLKTTRISKQQFTNGPRSPTPTPTPRLQNQSLQHLVDHQVKVAEERHIRKASPFSSCLEANDTRRPSLTTISSPTSRVDTSVEKLDPIRIDKHSRNVLPQSTNLPSFEYRSISRDASHSPKRTSFKEDVEATKERLRAEEKRRLSFTVSGNIKKRRSRKPSNESEPPDPSQNKSSFKLIQQVAAEVSPQKDKEQLSGHNLPAEEDSTSGQLGALPEAQIVQQPGLNNDRSVPSVELLETEKQSLKFRSTDEADFYNDLSTQAAMLQAQRSLQHDIDSPVALPVNPGHDGDTHKQSGIENPESAGAPGPEAPLPAADHEEPMSTQAMFDAVSPFVVTTVKKRAPIERHYDSTGSVSGSSPPSSPTNRDFRAASPSMSTTSSESPAPANNEPPIPLSALSKPTSTITSFSIAPNGTMTEVMQYDGQQQQNYHMGDSDLNAALEEAGSFLGDWSVEKEVRQLERSTAESKSSTAMASMV
ncbi:MAG: hypothetical protein Q9170_001040 [Blastenia crenularia]